MNGERAQTNGEVNAKDQSQIRTNAHRLASSDYPNADDRQRSGRTPTPSKPYINGGTDRDNHHNGGEWTRINGTNDMMIEPLNLIDQDAYLPIARLMNRTAQTCWNGLSSLIDQLSNISVPPQPPDPSRPSSAVNNNQTKANLDKKDRLLNFANDQKSAFIKLLVLLQWSAGAEDATKTIELNYWLMQRRLGYWDAIQEMAALKNDAVGFQLPNPDLRTAAQVLSIGRASNYSDLGYITPERLNPNRILRILRRLNRQLSIRLTTYDQLPSYLQVYHIHDGRVTFVVKDEFELDVSVMNEEPFTPFRLLDVRFLFSPCPLITSALHGEVERYGNLNIDRAGLEGAYDFLHDLTLSCKLNEFFRQATELNRSQWSGNLRIEFLHRTLVIQYWTRRSMAKSWIEIGIKSGRVAGVLETHPDSPSIEVRWMLEGQLVKDSGVEVDLKTLSVESILRQVTASHSNRILGTIYDRVVRIPMFSEEDLGLEQEMSSTNPDDCNLQIQLNSHLELRAQIDPVVGSLTLSPASGDTHALQEELNQTKNTVDEFVPRLLNHRAIVSEAYILQNIDSTMWERLAMFKLSQHEIKAVFGASSTRFNVYRLPSWPANYLMAISHNSHGDYWWLLQHESAIKAQDIAATKVVCSQQIRLTDTLSPAYFELLASFLSGVIFLQLNVAELERRQQKYFLGRLPQFNRNFVLPALLFDLDLVSGSSDDHLTDDGDEGQETPQLTQPAYSTRHERASNSTLELHYQNVMLAGVTNLVVKISLPKKSSVLKHLIQAKLDPTVSISGTSGLATFSIDASFSGPVIAGATEKALHLWDIYECTAKAKSFPSMTLKKLSMTEMMICYYKSNTTELSLDVQFSSNTKDLQIRFLPEETNPHRFLTMQLTKSLQNKRRGLAKSLSNILSSLTITYPLLSYLRQLQVAPSHANDSPSSDAAKTGHEALRVHVLARKPTVFALQYFSSAPQIPRDVLGPESHPRQLARFEIFPQILSGKTMWLVRPAIEEFDSYTRASYASSTLRTKIRQEIFAKQTGQVAWLRLDTAAACLSHQPEALLGPLHELIVQWVRDAKAGALAVAPVAPVPDPTPAPTTAQAPTNANAAQAGKPPKQAGSGGGNTNKPASKAPGTISMPNGIVNFAKQNSNQNQRPNSTTTRPNMAAMKAREVITLD